MTVRSVPRHRTSRASIVDAHAADHLRFIRTTMEHARSFTAVSGSGQALVGGLGFAAGAVASRSTTEVQWLSIWVAAALGAAIVAVVGIWRKSSRLGVSLVSGPARRFALSLIPPLLAGAILTVVFYRAGLVDQLPGMWAPSLRRRRRRRRDVVHSDCAGHGGLLHDAWRTRACCADALGQRVHGWRIRHHAHRVRRHHRGTTRWLDPRPGRPARTRPSPGGRASRASHRPVRCSRSSIALCTDAPVWES